MKRSLPRVLCISLPPDLMAKVKQQARNERRSVSEVAREALRRYLQQSEVRPKMDGGPQYGVGRKRKAVLPIEH